MTSDPADKALGRTLAEGLGIDPDKNQVDQALDATPPRFAEGEWTVTGPTNSGAYVISAQGRQIAVVTAVDCTREQTEAHARIMARSVHRVAILAHVLAELEGDDEGTRHAELIAMMREELKHAPL